ncbi:unnamed protein product [Ilex paraguariensis]|uniref:Uncharacterized protein n=1 Tax=Ilex paraguariensis TaxID=185542 RepID=A0ABC8U4K3_9AQUA
MQEQEEIEERGKGAPTDISRGKPDENEPVEDEESRKQRGKGNVEKWLQMLLENTQEGTDQIPQLVEENETSRTDEIIRKMNLKYPRNENEILKFPESEDKGVKQDLEENNQQTIQEKNNGGNRKKRLLRWKLWHS